MEITFLGDNSLKIRSKRASFIVDPSQAIGKTTADAVLILSNNNYDLKKVEESRLLITGPGEYEIGGVKISVVEAENRKAYSLSFDNISLLLAQSEVISLLSEKLKEHEVAVIRVDGELKENVITTVEPKVAVLYGNRAEEIEKALGKESQKLHKITITENKLPEEMEVVILK